jgi:glycosyltransferase involved in cell wall biosynthesis
MKKNDIPRGQENTRILLVHNLLPTIYGGGEKVTIDLINGLPSRKYKWTSVIRKGGRLAELLEDLEIPNVDLSIEGTYIGRKKKTGYLSFLLKNIFASFYLLHTLRQHKIDLIYTTTRGALIAASLAGRLTRTPVVSHFHDLPRNLAIYALFAYWGVGIIVAPSNFLKEKIRAVPIIGERLAERTKVVFNGIDARIVQDESKLSFLRHNLGLENYFPVVVNVGRVEEAKGQIDLVFAASEVIRSFPRARFIIVGDFLNDAVYYERLKQEILNRNLMDYIIFTGFQMDAVDFIAVSDFLVSTSRAEVLSIVVLEAMALSKPVIATQVGGASEQIVEGETGFLIPGSCPAVLADRISSLAQNRKLMLELGSNGRKRFENMFTLDLFISKMDEIFSQTAND